MIRHERRRAQPTGRDWSRTATRNGNALTLEPGIFNSTNPRVIAASLRQSALRSRRRKATPFRSAMSMLNFYINRAGKSLDAAHRAILERAKAELRRQFGKAPRKT